MRDRSSGSVRVFCPPYDRDALLAILRQRLVALRARLPVIRAVLFGSYATGRQMAGSDIDLLLVYAGAPRDDAYALVKRTLALPRLEPHLYTEEEYQQNRGTVDRMIRDGIPIAFTP